MLKHINLQFFAEGENTGVNNSAAAGQEMATQGTTQGASQGTTDTQPSQENTGANQQAAAAPNESVEKAFAARFAKERERLEAELRQKYEAELKNNPHLSYLEQKAQRLGMTVEQLIENDRKYEEQQRLNELIQKNIPEEYARKLMKVDELEQWKAQQEQQRQAELQRQQQEQYRQQMYQEFLQMYPEFNDPEKIKQIPAEVWQMVKQGHRPAAAYAIYENKQLKQQYQTQQANQKNAENSTGSVKSPGATGGFISREQFDANKHDINWVRRNLKQIEESRKHWK